MAIRLGSAYGKVEIDSSGVKSGVDSALGSFEKLKGGVAKVGQTLQQLGTFMTATFTVPLALAGRSAIRTFADYEKAMNILGSVSGATAEEMEKLSKLAKDLGADLTLPGTSAADAAEAMAELAKAGLSVNEIMSAAKGVLQMSAAGQLSNAEAAEITANALNAFKLSGSEAVRIADLLAAGANSSSAEVREMADSLKMSSAVFANAGMHIEDLVTAISLMANSGIQGSDAGTSLKQMLLSLQAPSKKAKALMDDLGIKIYDAAGKMLPMRDIIKNFQKQLSGLTQEQRNAALATIFGSDAVRAANIVLLGGVDAYDKMYLAVNKTGAAANLAAAMMQGLTGAMENLKSAFETASIAAIEPFKEDIAKLLEFVAKALNAFAALPAPLRKIIVVMLVLLAVMGPILVFFGTMLSMAANIVGVFGALGISITTVGTALGSMVGVLFTAGTALLSILGPILLVVGAVALLYWAFKTNFMGITDTAKQLAVVIPFLFKQIGTQVGTTAKQLWEIIKYYFGLVWKKITDTFKTINWGQIGKYMLMGLANGMLGGIPLIIAAAYKAAKAALDAIKKALGISSPSKEFEKLGGFSGLGYVRGVTGSMNPNSIAKAVAKPAQSLINNQQQTNTMYFANGLTLKDVDRMMAQREQVFLRRLGGAMGGA